MVVDFGERESERRGKVAVEGIEKVCSGRRRKVVVS
jgi:hypothetical protein